MSSAFPSSNSTSHPPPPSTSSSSPSSTLTSANTSTINHPPSHGHPDRDPATGTATATSLNTAPAATASHPPSGKPDPTVHASSAPSAVPDSSLQHATQAGLAASPAASAAELARLKIKLRNGLRQFPDFPSPGVLFEDIMPLFASPSLHATLIRALELQLVQEFPTTPQGPGSIDVIIGLESRGFLFAPTLALRLGAAFVPVRKKGKLPGPTETESFQKEYGADFFQLQSDAIQPGQRVVIMDDIIATGGSASAAGRLVRKLGGELLGYVFLMELDFLKGRDKLDAPVHTLLSGQEEALRT